MLALWMTPAYKAFEMTLALGAVFFGTRLLERPTLARHLAAGVYCGITAWFARNYGGYVGVAFLALIAAAHWRVESGPLLRRLATFGAGVLLGYLPMLLFLFVPGFLEGFVEMNLWLLRQGTTNRPRPVPWPWQPPYESYLLMSAPRAARHFLLGSFFVVIPLFPVAVAAAMARTRARRPRAMLIAAAAVGATCAHYAFSRADPGHLASAIHPLLLGVMALPAARDGWNRTAVVASTLAGLLVVSALSIGTEHPLSVKGDGTGWVERVVADDEMTIRRSDAALIRVVRGLGLQPGATAPLLAAPVYPGLYPILDVRSPVWTLIFTLPEPVERQQALVDALDEADTEWAFVCDRPLDWRDDLRLSRAFEVLWDTLAREWELVPITDLGLPDDCEIRHRRSPSER